MSRSVYILDIAVAALGIGVYLHVSDHDGKYVTRAEFGKHLAEMRVELERLGASGRDVVPSTTDVDAEAHANAPMVRPDSVADKGIDEVGERNDCANRYKDGGFCFHGEHYTTIKENAK